MISLQVHGPCCNLTCISNASQLQYNIATAGNIRWLTNIQVLDAPQGRSGNFWEHLMSMALLKLN